MQLDAIDTDIVYFTLKNSLPHDLPTGIYGNKELFIVLSWLENNGTVLEKKKINIPSVLAPEEQKSFAEIFPKSGYTQKLSIDLFRFDHSTKKATLIRSYPFVMISSHVSQ